MIEIFAIIVLGILTISLALIVHRGNQEFLKKCSDALKTQKTF